MRPGLIHNDTASAVPPILFILAILGAGALYTLLIVEIGQPIFDSYIPSGAVKTFVMMIIYGLPGIILVIGVISLVRSGLKQEVMY